MELPHPMTSAEIVAFFSHTRVKGLSSFRSLCNALKFWVMQQSVTFWKETHAGRLTVLDVGCGRGGDLRKWASLRLKTYVGVDASENSIAEAKTRHASLVTQGQTALSACFFRRDLLLEPLPMEAGTVDIVSSMFFLQFSFGSERSARFLLDEVARVLKPGGVLACILPDGDLVYSLLSEGRETPFLGHFRLERCHVAAREDKEGQETVTAASSSPYGLAYNYALANATGWCTEFLVSSRLLSQLLTERHFEPVFSSGSFLEGSQELLSTSEDRQTVLTILQGEKCSQLDWLSLGFFNVLMARKS